MTNPETDPGAFFNRRYWDGHTFGHGEAESIEKPPMDRMGAQAAFSAMMKYIEGNAAISRPVKKYAQGEAFSAEEHKAGTIVVYGREFILCTGPVDPEYLERCAELPLPERPSFDSFYDLLLGDSEANMPNTRLENESGTYRSSIYMGAVVTGADLNPMIMAVSAEMDSQSLRVKGPIVQELPVLTVGEVTHLDLDRPGAEWIQRVNVLELAHEG